MVARGEVWWGDDPDAGRRPFLVLTRDAAIPLLNQVTVLAATTTIRGLRSEVPLDEADGMPRPCVVNADMITRMPAAWLTERITQLPPEKLRAVCRALAVALDCG